jgi:hypothetical protein
MLYMIEQSVSDFAIIDASTLEATMATQANEKSNALRLKFRANYMRKRILAAEVIDSLRRENKNKKVA